MKFKAIKEHQGIGSERRDLHCSTDWTNELNLGLPLHQKTYSVSTWLHQKALLLENVMHLDI
jgi:hypothetical protein